MSFLERLRRLSARTRLSPARSFFRLVPGKVLLGKYPGQIPADLTTGPTVQIARDRVLDIVLRGGVTDLYCLQVGAC